MNEKRGRKLKPHQVRTIGALGLLAFWVVMVFIIVELIEAVF